MVDQAYFAWFECPDCKFSSVTPSFVLAVRCPMCMKGDLGPVMLRRQALESDEPQGWDARNEA